MSEARFVYVIYLATTPQRLFKALTDPGDSQQYWAGRQVESRWSKGASVSFRKLDGKLDPVRAKVLDVEPPQRLVMSWTYDLGDGSASPPASPPASRVSYGIESVSPNNVKLTVTHEQDEPGSSIDEGLRSGWPAILSSLKSFLETGKGLELLEQWGKEGK